MTTRLTLQEFGWMDEMKLYVKGKQKREVYEKHYKTICLEKGPEWQREKEFKLKELTKLYAKDRKDTKKWVKNMNTIREDLIDTLQKRVNQGKDLLEVHINKS